MDSDAIEESAARWFVRRGGSNWTEQDEASFNAWLDAALIHRIEFIRVEAAWHQAARMEALGAGVPSGSIPARGEWGDARFFSGLSLQPPPAAKKVGGAADHRTPPVEAKSEVSGCCGECTAGRGRSALHFRLPSPAIATRLRSEGSTICGSRTAHTSH